MVLRAILWAPACRRSFMDASAKKRGQGRAHDPARLRAALAFHTTED